MKKTLQTLAVQTLAISSLLLPTLALGAKPSYSPMVGKDYPQQVYWGDTHLHTSYSFDAAMMGNKQLGPEQAYRFARGEEVKGNQGMVARLNRPLDFLMVSDHAEYLGLIPILAKEASMLMNDPVGKHWAEMLKAGGDVAKKAMFEMHHDINTATPRLKNEQVRRSAWQDIIAIADRFNEPGKFTTFAGYEWTTMPGGNNLHRVVLFADDASKTGQILPFSSFDSEDPEDLWLFLEDYEENTGGRVLAIPHNGNASDGLMFALTDRKGNPLTRRYAETRSRWEPLYEVTQIKGDGETHPRLSPNDEFADFEPWDKGNLIGITVKQDAMLPYEYARSALKLGLQQEQQLGVNPFKFGMIGSTDAHTSMSTADENNFWGKMSIYEPSSTRASELGYKKGQDGKRWDFRGEEFSAAGYAAVWATENTRQALFEAMKRRETYATTGPRMTVRFFAGWELQPEDINHADYVDRGYRKGVPMGGDLSQAPTGIPLRFLVAASKDPEGANLDRVQIVKGWLDANGQTHERVYDVVWSGERRPDANGKLPPVGNTVDVSAADWTNTIGAVQLATVWTDPDFDPSQRAFYYVRVLQIPTPRWTAYDEKYFGFKLDKQRPASIQERAYSSPIWYTP